MRKSSRGNPYHDEQGRFCSAEKASGIWCGDRDIDVSDMTTDEKRALAEELNKNPETAEFYESQSGYRAFIRSFFGEKGAEKELEAYDSLSKEDKRAYQACVNNEELITNELEEECNLVGKEFRLKSPSSIKGKLARKGGSVATFWDVVRYTHTSESDELMADTTAILERLESTGHTVCNFANTWNDDTNPYNGINVKMLSPLGQRYELQFHTSESFELKNGDLHALYELSRKLDEKKDKSRADKILQGQLKSRMFALSEALEKPKNVARTVKWEIR